LGRKENIPKDRRLHHICFPGKETSLKLSSLDLPYIRKEGFEGLFAGNTCCILEKRGNSPKILGRRISYEKVPYAVSSLPYPSSLFLHEWQQLRHYDYL
jgi:hypothetical protein